jgi:hypothetical protein
VFLVLGRPASIGTTFAGGILRAVQVGEVLLIDDVVTDFDRYKSARPCLIVRVVDQPRAGAWVLPRSTQPNSRGTFVPAGALRGLNKDGWFMVLPRFAAAGDLEGVRSLGVLPSPHLENVLENMNDVVIDLDIDL